MKASRRKQLAAAGIAAALIAVAPQAADAVTPQRAMPNPAPAKVTAQGVTVRSQLGSYCVNGEPEGNMVSGGCADAIPSRPGPAHTLRVAPRTSLRIQFGDRPRLQDTVKSASASLVRFDADDHPEYVGDSIKLERDGKNWSLKLPKKLHRANALSMFTRLEGSGDISHFVGLKASRRQRLQCPGERADPVEAAPLRGLTVKEATAEAKSRGCLLRVVRIDGVEQAITEDFSLSRVNVFIRDDLVVAVDGFY